MAGKGQAEGCASCAKWCLIIFNVLFCLIGIGLVAAGVYAYIQLSDYLSIVGNPMINAPAIVLIAFGCITFIIAAIGCIGACKESSCLLFVFAVIIGVLLVSEIAAGIAGFVYRGKIEEWFDANSAKLMKGYKQGNDHVETKAWDAIQEKLECCGVNGVADWTNSTITPQQAATPKSCGKFTEGCKPKIVRELKDKMLIVGGIGVAFGLIELLGIILACCVACNARKGEMA